MSDKHLDKKIKEGFEGMDRKAPEGLWDNLNEELSSGDALDAKVKDSFVGLGTAAPEEVWEGVNKQLTIDKAWRQIRGVLNRRTLWRRSRRAGALLLLLLLFGWAGITFFGDPFTTPAVNDQAVAELQKEKSSSSSVLDQGTTDPESTSAIRSDNDELNESESENIAGSDLEEQESGNDPVFNTSFSGTSVTEPGIENENLVVADQRTTEVVQPDITPASNYPTRMPLVRSGLYVDVPDVQFAMVELPTNKPDEPVTKPRRFEMGLIYSLNNTTILNNETRSSFNSQSLVSTNATFGSSYGLSGMYHITPNQGIAGWGYLQARTKQVNNTYIEGRYVQQAITLDHWKLALAYQRSFTGRATALNARYMIRGGFYSALLKQAVVTSHSNADNSADTYTQTDLGLTLQAGQELEFGRFVLGYGLNGEKGLQNIFSGDSRTPADFDHTSTFNVGGFVTARFKL